METAKAEWLMNKEMMLWIAKWSLKGMPAASDTITGRAISHTVSSAITAKFFCFYGTLKSPKRNFSNGKRKAPTQKKKSNSQGTIADHYLKSLEAPMDEMDCFLELKGYYIVMDNAPIHTAGQIDVMIVARGYRNIYLPPYSPELNSTEQFWSIVKNKSPNFAVFCSWSFNCISSTIVIGFTVNDTSHLMGNSCWIVAHFVNKNFESCRPLDLRSVPGPDGYC
ncbi:hypothetical protein MAM1_0354d09969 [Mucor ambiguus]|uniref:Tc1-like transposase DDE domain-containing protein n=1 Tax=Mucor ambiguus TaxID=91626 RepID=A0A0C9N726_9FUNG|nr:hypothetical protein MAM1_0354d09969 [Mucor ambiguus]